MMRTEEFRCAKLSLLLKGCESVSENKYMYEDFLEIIAKLRAKDGCPWDREQTHRSLRSCMIEEAYEAADAIDNGDMDNLKEELGDVLLQVVMHAQIAREEGRFDMDDIITGVSEKMIRRHPHIFGDSSVDGSGQVAQNWEAIKRQEKHETTAYEGIARVPRALPANIRAAKILKKAEAAGWDFGGMDAVKNAVCQDWKALEQAAQSGTQETLEDVFGTLMLDMVNLSRFLGVNAENSLTNAMETFINRFGSAENLANSTGLPLSHISGRGGSLKD